MVSLVIGIIFFGQQMTQDGVMNINGAIFLFLTNMTFQNVFAVINVRWMSIVNDMRVLLYLKFSVRWCSISGILHRATCIFTRITKQTLPNWHVLLGKIISRISTVSLSAIRIHFDCLSDGRPANDFHALSGSLIYRCVGGECGHVVRVLYLVRQLVRIDGAQSRTTGHHSISVVWWFLLECWLRAAILQMAVVFVLVPLWQRSAAHQPVGRCRTRRNCVHPIEHHVSSQWACGSRNAQFQWGMRFVHLWSVHKAQRYKRTVYEFRISLSICRTLFGLMSWDWLCSLSHSGYLRISHCCFAHAAKNKMIVDYIFNTKRRQLFCSFFTFYRYVPNKCLLVHYYIYVMNILSSTVYRTPLNTYFVKKNRFLSDSILNFEYTHALASIFYVMHY